MTLSIDAPNLAAAAPSRDATLAEVTDPRILGVIDGYQLAVRDLHKRLAEAQASRDAVIEERLEIAIGALEKIANRGAGPIAHRLECKAALEAIRALKSSPPQAAPKDALSPNAKPQLAVHGDAEQSNGTQEGAMPSAAPKAEANDGGTWVPIEGTSRRGGQWYGLVKNRAPQAEEAEAERLAERPAEVAHALIRMAGQYEGYDERKRRYTAALNAFATEVRAAALIRWSNEQAEDDVLRDAEVAEAERRGAEKMRDRCEAKAREVACGPYGSIAGDAIRDLPLD